MPSLIIPKITKNENDLDQAWKLLVFKGLLALDGANILTFKGEILRQFS